LIALKRTGLGAQVVTINAELLHFHSTPPASESSIGGIDLIGAKSAAQASVRNATISKGRFIAILPGSGLCGLAAFLHPSFDQEALLSGVGFSFSSRARKNGFAQWTNCFMAAWPTKPLHTIATDVTHHAPRARLPDDGLDPCHASHALEWLRAGKTMS
jgi:hypothetical protein